MAYAPGCPCVPGPQVPATCAQSRDEKVSVGGCGMPAAFKGGIDYGGSVLKCELFAHSRSARPRVFLRFRPSTRSPEFGLPRFRPSCPSPIPSTRIPKHLPAVVPRHPRLAQVSAGFVRFRRFRAMSAIPAICHPSPLASTRIPKALTEVIPRYPNAGPVRARCSRGWAQIGVGLS
jgi:hypothetical protein